MTMYTRQILLGSSLAAGMFALTIPAIAGGPTGHTNQDAIPLSHTNQDRVRLPQVPPTPWNRPSIFNHPALTPYDPDAPDQSIQSPFVPRMPAAPGSSPDPRAGDVGPLSPSVASFLLPQAAASELFDRDGTILFDSTISDSAGIVSPLQSTFIFEEIVSPPTGTEFNIHSGGAITMGAIPSPGVLPLLGLGLGALAGKRRRRSR